MPGGSRPVGTPGKHSPAPSILDSNLVFVGTLVHQIRLRRSKCPQAAGL